MATRGAAREPESSTPARLVVIGASMGGIEALRALFAELPAGLDAAFVIVLHRSTGINVLPSILTRHSGQHVELAYDGQLLERGGIYVSPGGLHTRVDEDRLTVAIGPRENGHRPSVDALFRSAARSFGNRVIGVVLSGALDCGAAGLFAIKQQGGLSVVQDPETALNPQMPESAMDVTPPDYVESPKAMGPLLAKLVRQPLPRRRQAKTPREKPASFVCPECNGPIWETSDGAYRCRTGHRYSPESFFKLKEGRLENALWEALNIMQERVELSQRMAARARENGHSMVAERYDARGRETEENAAVLRDLVCRSDSVIPEEEAVSRRRASGNGGRKRKRGV